MTQNKPDLSHWFDTDDFRGLAEIKFQMKKLESHLNKYLNLENEQGFCPPEANTLCHALAHKYLEYLKLIDGSKYNSCFEFPMPGKTLNWHKQYLLILHLKQQLFRTTSLEEECRLIAEIASLYYHFNQLTRPPLLSTTSNNSELFKKIFRQEELQSWLIAVVDFWNESNVQSLEPSTLFHEWNPQQLQGALDYFSAPDLVSLVNALFFYKLYPDKLFNELIHPEKLVSVRARVGLLHHYIERLESNLYSTALQQGLKPALPAKEARNERGW
ncbi:hypothetical protein TUM19329_32200 [Legionella antarctica]|uniref:Uncharacterized protein n=1 Tax=Legionella antarctica TaxID=2708020 RepID=A0A6F8T8Q3_9GAMM|nr:hypothetical protein [Legionella antarctica]BCA96859.1 hypothetical protein TUM19329_32200 [Legionella antarctica]